MSAADGAAGAVSAADGAAGAVSAADGIRARAAHVLAVHEETRRTVLEEGVLERELKELCARYLAEGDESIARHERERAALAWADAIAWDAERANDALWERLHAHFSEPELVELGYSIAIMLGQQHWLATLGVVER